MVTLPMPIRLQCIYLVDKMDLLQLRKFFNYQNRKNFNDVWRINMEGHFLQWEDLTNEIKGKPPEKRYIFKYNNQTWT